MLTFCPYEFKEINMNNLAYELVFPKKWNWEDVKNKTVVGTKKLPFISENDTRREKHFKKNDEKHIILLENSKGGKNGLALFKELIAYRNTQMESQMQEEKIDGIEFDAGDFGDEEEIKLLYWNLIDGIDTFLDKDEDVVMCAMPCCPKCHNRLPMGWNDAEDFAAISLMAPSGGGKTTFLYSMMHNNWEAFQSIQNRQMGKIYITAAHRMNDKKDVSYAQMKANEEEMCKSGGKCPESTDKDHWIPPVFLNVQYNNHVLIIGIYDNAGEHLRIMDVMENENLSMLLKNMFAEIFLFDPKHLNIALPLNAPTDGGLPDFQILSLGEQGKYQKENALKVISAKDILAPSTPLAGVTGNVTDAMEVYSNHKASLQQNKSIGGLKRLKEMYFCGVIIKSDLLEQCEEIKSNGEYKHLFQHKKDEEKMKSEDIWDLDAMEVRGELVEDMIQELQLFGNRDINNFKLDFGEIDDMGNKTNKKAVSWHCVSALGCATDEDKLLTGDYNPIRVAEPLVACIIKRLIDNEW